MMKKSSGKKKNSNVITFIFLNNDLPKIKIKDKIKKHIILADDRA